MDNTPSRGPGRPPAVIDLPFLTELAGLGLSAEHIASRMGVSRSLLFARMQEDPATREAYAKGVAAGTETAARGIQELIKQKNFAALAFYLRCKGGWRQDAAPAPAVVINIGDQPASVTIDAVNEMAARQRLLVAGRR